MTMVCRACYRRRILSSMCHCASLLLTIFRVFPCTTPFQLTIICFVFDFKMVSVIEVVVVTVSNVFSISTLWRSHSAIEFSSIGMTTNVLMFNYILASSFRIQISMSVFLQPTLKSRQRIAKAFLKLSIDCLSTRDDSIRHDVHPNECKKEENENTFSIYSINDKIFMNRLSMIKSSWINNVIDRKTIMFLLILCPRTRTLHSVSSPSKIRTWLNITNYWIFSADSFW
jgi:hypothetical protein